VLIAIFGCAADDCVDSGITGMLAVGLGLGIGAAFGAMADSFHEQRVEVYSRPVTTPNTLSTAVTRKIRIGTVIRW
jgi:hypothetical protein